MTSAQQIREQSLRDINKSASGNNLNSEDALCPGCGTSAMREEGGLVVAFGQSFFHVDCFRCAKCHEKVTADTNLLLLSDGSPVCANCTYCCTICQQAINDEAIMAGDDSFHAHCFKCKICKNRIDELTYARTSHGIYCMDCHNDRVARNRRHAQKKAEMAAAGGIGSTKSRSLESKKFEQENERSNSIAQNRATTPRPIGPAPSSSLDGSHILRGAESNGKTKTGRYVNDAFFPPDKLPITSEKNAILDKQNSVPVVSSNTVSRTRSLDNGRQTSSKQNKLAAPNVEDHANQRESFEDVVRPLNVIPKQSTHKTPTAKVDSSTLALCNTNGRIPSPMNADYPTSSSIPSSPAHSHSHVTARLSSSSSRSHPNESNLVDCNLHSPTSPAFNNFDSSTSALRPSTLCMSPNRTSETDGDAVASKSELGLTSDDLNRVNGSSPHNPIFNSDHSSSRRKSYLTSPQAGYAARSPSPIHRVDVPDSVDNGTDNEMDSVESLVAVAQQRPLPPPPNQGTDHNLQHADFGDLSASSSIQHYVPEESGLTPTFGASQMAYIAPALPPIRFSMNSADFSDLLSTVSGLRSPLSQLAEHNETGEIPRATSIEQYVQPPLYSLEQKHLPLLLAPPNDADNSFTIMKAGDPLKDFVKSSTEDRMANSNTSTVNVGGAKCLPSDFTSELETSSSLPGVDEGLELVLLHLRRLLQEETEAKVIIDRKLIQTAVKAYESQQGELVELRAGLDGIKRTNKQYFEGLTVAQAEYDHELRARRDAETEVTRLRILLSGQTARLTALACDNRRQEQRRKSIQDTHENLQALENDLAKLLVERETILVEIQELSNLKSSNTSPTSVLRTLNQSMENLKTQYQRDLVPLKQERHTLVRETSELRVTRDALLEEAAVLNARNEELVVLNREYLRRMDLFPSTKEADHVRKSQEKSQQHQQIPYHLLPSTSVISIPLNEEENRNKGNQKNDSEIATPLKKFKWPGSRGKEMPHTHMNDLMRIKPQQEHNFTQTSILRFTRCYHCGDKMWGSQLRCTLCNLSVHGRCAGTVHTACTQNMGAMKDEHATPVQSMFGKDLTEQATMDCAGADYLVPCIVDKCIEAVEALALDYEGIYRKTGGAGQTRLITQLFERGDYAAFDLRDSERFPDICSVTSVLKNYFRTLPIPLLTFDLYDEFISAAQFSEPGLKYQTLRQLVNRLPRAHYQTLQKLMLHLHCIHEHSDQNRMNARNLGVVFGPTLMKSRYPGSEFNDMAGKALSIEWLVENAPSIFID